MDSEVLKLLISEGGCWATFTIVLLAYIHHLRECPKPRRSDES